MTVAQASLVLHWGESLLSAMKVPVPLRLDRKVFRAAKPGKLRLSPNQKNAKSESERRSITLFKNFEIIRVSPFLTLGLA
jgi:hypothetical protein